MLNVAEQRLIADNFTVFEHEWRFYQWILGEAHLVEGHLCYYDGRILYICAFTPGAAEPKADLVALIGQIITDPRFASAEFVDIWGPTDIVEKIDDRGHGFTKMGRYGPFSREHVLDVRVLSQSLPSKARAALNAARNRGTTSSVVNAQYLSSDHMVLMRQFCKDKEVPPTLMSFVVATPFALSWPDSVIIEARDADSRLEGFAVISRPVQDAAVLLQGFYSNERGSRAGDAVMHGILHWAENEGVAYVHLGYSPSESLRHFKEKWGGSQVGATYSELFLRRGSSEESLDGGFFPWKESLLWHRIQELS